MRYAGDKVVTFRYGQFSHLWIDMMQRLGLDVTVIDRPWGEGADEAILQVGCYTTLCTPYRLSHILHAVSHRMAVACLVI
jgi:aspartate aminotransferase-like enzyme